MLLPFDNGKNYQPNKYYKSTDGKFYFYINTKGYYHIIKPCKVNYYGVHTYYTIDDYLLTKDNTLKKVKHYGYYETLENLIEVIEKNLAEN